MYTLDTNVLIYYLANEFDTIQLINNTISSNYPLYVSAISVAEMTSLSILTNTELLTIQKTLELFSILAVDTKIASIAGSIRRTYSTVKLPDALIAATALFTNTKLVTRNVKDFQKIKELKIISI